MPELFNPLWLFALALLPLVRWLHRWHEPLSSWSVSAIFLWNDAGADMAAGATKRKPDPAWRRRAAILGLLIIALAGPYYQSGFSELTVWVDDSLSMGSVEDGTTRVELGLKQLSIELSDHPVTYDRITLRSLTDPARVKRLRNSRILDGPDRFIFSDWFDVAPGKLAALTVNTMELPPVAFMNRESAHWLVTDGASIAVRQWAIRAALMKVIQTGKTTENVAVFRLAARHSLNSAGQFDVLIGIVNQGLGTALRELVLDDGDQVLARETVSLEPAQKFYFQTRVPLTLGGTALMASIASEDTLQLDDRLVLDTDSLLPLRTRVSEGCGTVLQRALRAHPLLEVNGVTEAWEADPSLIIECEAGNPAIVANSGSFILDNPTWLPAAGHAQELSLVKHWISISGGSRTSFISSKEGFSASSNGGDSVTFSRRSREALAPVRQVLLQVGGKPLVVRLNSDQNHSVVVETGIDMAHPVFVRQPEFPAFVARLIDLVTGVRLLEKTAIISREPRASIIVPGAIERSDEEESAFKLRMASRPLSRWFLIGALLLLVLDIVLRWRQVNNAS